jgi:hypothetical protein
MVMHNIKTLLHKDNLVWPARWLVTHPRVLTIASPHPQRPPLGLWGQVLLRYKPGDACLLYMSRHFIVPQYMEAQQMRRLPLHRPSFVGQYEAMVYIRMEGIWFFLYYIFTRLS